MSYLEFTVLIYLIISYSQHNTDDGKEYDAERTQFLEALDLKVVRYWNHEILNNTDVVLEDLWNYLFSIKRRR